MVGESQSKIDTVKRLLAEIEKEREDERKGYSARIEGVEGEMRSKIDGLMGKVRSRIEGVEGEMRLRIEDLEREMRSMVDVMKIQKESIRRLGGMVKSVTQTTVHTTRIHAQPGQPAQNHTKQDRAQWQKAGWMEETV